jgi:hypothetical protein
MSTLEVFSAHNFVESMGPNGEKQLTIGGGFYSWYAPKTIRAIDSVILNTGPVDSDKKKKLKKYNALVLENVQSDYFEKIKANIQECRELQAHAEICFERNRLQLNRIAYTGIKHSD